MMFVNVQNLQDARGRAVAVYGPLYEWSLNLTTDDAKNTRIGERFTEFMKVSKTCALSANQGCFKNSIAKTLTNNNFENIDAYTSKYKIVLADGTSVAFYNVDSLMFVDIDGPTKGQNTFGKDIFVFEVENNEIIPYKCYENTTFADLLEGRLKEGMKASCWILRYDNADYLKFTDDNGTCPNGTTVSEANPRCK